MCICKICIIICYIQASLNLYQPQDIKQSRERGWQLREIMRTEKLCVSTIIWWRGRRMQQELRQGLLKMWIKIKAILEF